MVPKRHDKELPRRSLWQHPRIQLVWVLQLQATLPFVVISGHNTNHYPLFMLASGATTFGPSVTRRKPMHICMADPWTHVASQIG